MKTGNNINIETAGCLARAMFGLFLLAFLFLIAPASHAEDHVAKIQKAYEGIKDIKGSFIQKSQIKDLKRTDSYTGWFFIKPPKMKWEYIGQKAQVIYINGEEIVVHQKKENQVFKSRFDRATYGQAPIALLAGMGDIRKEFDIVSDSQNRLVLKPKKAMGNIDHIEIIPSEGAFPIKALTIVDNLSNKIEIKLMDVKTNSGLKDSLFNFTPPKGATVIQN